jgi:hypothetical protein
MNSSPALFRPELKESINTTVNSVPAGTAAVLGAGGGGGGGALSGVGVALGADVAGLLAGVEPAAGLPGCPAVADAVSLGLDVQAERTRVNAIMVVAIRENFIFSSCF